MKLIFEKSIPGCPGHYVDETEFPDTPRLPPGLLRKQPPALPELPEGEIVRHFTRLSQLNFSIDTHFYPLGSCTMKYNPKACERVAATSGFADLHPIWPQFPGGEHLVQGALHVLHETERWFCELTGMDAFTLQPLAGSHGELTALMIMAAYHNKQGNRKNHIIIPDSAHGTNPASAALAGYDVVTIPSDSSGIMDIEQCRAAINEQTAGLMLTCPNTVGVFNPRIEELASMIHGQDGLMYYDGANLNAILGRCKPGRMGFDLCHLNVHKTFGTPHGGGGPGAGPVGVIEKLRPYLPISRVARRQDGTYHLVYDEPDSIGYVAPFYGNFGVLLKAYAYLLLLGGEGLKEVSGTAVLHANYLQALLRPVFQPASENQCMHECVFSGETLAQHGVRTLDLAKALIDRGIHPPTVYFPLNVPEAIMIEPTETESKTTLDLFARHMLELANLARNNPDQLHNTPRTTPTGRLDEVLAARLMDLAYTPPPEQHRP